MTLRLLSGGYDVARSHRGRNVRGSHLALVRAAGAIAAAKQASRTSLVLHCQVLRKERRSASKVLRRLRVQDCAEDSLERNRSAGGGSAAK
jgi:hypothetical protein